MFPVTILSAQNHSSKLMQRLNTGQGTQSDKKIVRPERYIIDHQGYWHNWSMTQFQIEGGGVVQGVTKLI